MTKNNFSEKDNALLQRRAYTKNELIELGRKFYAHLYVDCVASMRRYYRKRNADPEQFMAALRYKEEHYIPLTEKKAELLGIKYLEKLAHDREYHKKRYHATKQ